MLTYQDCKGLCPLTDEEIRAIAHHEHVPEIIALELGNYLCETADGEKRIKRIIIDDIDEAKAHGDTSRVEQLHHVLAHFLAMHDRAA